MSEVFSNDWILEPSVVALHQNEGYIDNLLQAWQRAPHRAEPLYDLARYYNMRGQPRPALLFALAGLRLPLPGDGLVDKALYTWGLKYEVAQAALQCGPQQRARAGEIIDFLLRCPEFPSAQKSALRQQVEATPVGKLYRSLECHASGFGLALPEGWFATNPSILAMDGSYWLSVRAVNYRTDLANGCAEIADVHGVGRSRTFFLELDRQLNCVDAVELPPPSGLPVAPLGHRSLGLEDMRLFFWRDQVWGIAATAEHSAADLSEMVITSLHDPARWWFVRTGRPRDEKNWMPIIGSDGWFVHSLSPYLLIVDHAGRTVVKVKSSLPGGLRGSSQCLPISGGRWLCMVHEAGALDRQRFCLFDIYGGGTIGEAFYFVDPDTEFVGGMCRSLDDPGQLIISFGVRDQECWFARIALNEVLVALARS